MRKFWVDFSASVKVNAETEEEAKEYFFNLLPNDFQFATVETVEPIYDEDD